MVCSDCLADDAPDRPGIEQLRESAVPAWKSQADFATGIEGEYLQAEESPSKPRVERNVKFAVNNGLLKASVSVPGMSDYVLAINAEYFFLIGKLPSRTSYAIADIGANDTANKELQSRVDESIDELKAATGVPWRLIVEPLYERIVDPEFEVKSVSKVGELEGERIKVEFEYHTDDDALSMKSGSYVVLDPNQMWSVQEYRIIRNWGEISAHCEYGEPIDGIPILRKKTETLVGHDDPENNRLVRTLEFRQLQQSRQPEEKFLLTEYGLPEPNVDALRAADSGRGRWMWMLINAAIILALLAWIIHRRRQVNAEA